MKLECPNCGNYLILETDTYFKNKEKKLEFACSCGNKFIPQKDFKKNLPKPKDMRMAREAFELLEKRREHGG